MKRFIVGSTWDRTNRNGINNNFDYLFEGVATMNNLNIKADATLLKADSVLMNAQNINQSNVDVQNQLDEIIVESGTSDAEVVQSRLAYNGEEFTTLKNRLDKRDENLLTRTINAIDFGIVGDGVTDDTLAIQSALDYAKDNGGELFLPEGTYLISSTLYLNGVTLRGNVGNIFVSGKGTIIKCATKDFKAVAQGFTSAKDIQFNISNIIIEDALVGLELNYVINSKYENIYVKNSDIAYKFGDKTSVGSMFNEFNNLYTRGCRIGIESNSNEFFNNNVFNNGYIQGTDYSAKFSVSGGYGGVNNVFNNVEFRSPKGRGLILERMINTALNHCYLEVGGYNVHLKAVSSVNLNNCIYGMFQSDNTHGDRSLIYLDEHASHSTVTGGRVFLNDNYKNVDLVSKHSSVDSARFLIKDNVKLVGNTSEIGFSNNPGYGEVLDTNKLDRFVSLSPTKTEVPNDTTFKMSDFTVNKNTESINGSEIKLTKGYWMIDINIKLNMTAFNLSKYLYIRKNGSNIFSQIHSLNSDEKMLTNLSVHATEYFDGDDILEIVLYHSGGASPIEINDGKQSYIRLKYLG